MAGLLASHASEVRTLVWIFVYSRAKCNHDELILCNPREAQVLKRSELEFQERRYLYHHTGGSGAML